ncbi:hypothetical protein C5167_045070 [Papaver somniferum]|uniref:Uncharacterized protein n=1 Tax=Papaver somniferum TaxID=3469 RepID=A0A4Y7L9S5_PAPSO|nr:hypothetical protein C5167_045070 [Papaver somniferum]
MQWSRPSAGCVHFSVSELALCGASTLLSCWYQFYLDRRHGKSVVPKLLHAGTMVVVLKLAFQGTPIF